MESRAWGEPEDSGDDSCLSQAPFPVALLQDPLGTELRLPDSEILW
jgi:hypothetical protein